MGYDGWLASFATSRMLNQMDDISVTSLRHLLREMVMERLRRSALVRMTVYFDGCVQSTSWRAERARRLASTKEKRALVANTRCSARSARQVKCWTSCLVRETFTTRRERGGLFGPVFQPSATPIAVSSRCCGQCVFQ